MQPGGAGVPYYIGAAQCSSCKGHGFQPCPVCVGYEAELPPPDPANGPASQDSLDTLVSTMRWLRCFPDSRSKRARRCAVWLQRRSFTAILNGPQYSIMYLSCQEFELPASVQRQAAQASCDCSRIHTGPLDRQCATKKWIRHRRSWRLVVVSQAETA